VPNEIQQFEFSEELSAGTFTLTLGAETTAAIDWDYTTGEIESALGALTGIGPGNVQVNSWDGTTLVVEFIGALANTNIAQMTCDATNAGYDTGDVDVQITVNGVAGVNEVQQISFGQTPTGGDFRINGILVNGGHAATAADIEAAIEDAGGANTPCSVAGAGPFDVTYDAQGDISDSLLDFTDSTVYLVPLSSTETQAGGTGVNETQTILWDNTALGWLAFGGEQSDTMVTGATTAVEFQVALEEIAALTGNVSVTGTSLATGLTVEFVAGLAETDVGLIDLRESAGISKATTTQGVTAVQQQEEITLPASTTGGTWSFTGSIVSLDWDATAGEIEADIESSLSIQCAVSGSAPQWTVTRDATGPFSGLEIGVSNVTGDVTCEESTTQEGSGGAAPAYYQRMMARRRAG